MTQLKNRFARMFDIKKYPRLQFKVKNLIGPFYILIKRDGLFMDGSCKFGERENAWTLHPSEISYWRDRDSMTRGCEIRFLTFTQDLPLSEKDFEA